MFTYEALQRLDECDTTATAIVEGSRSISFGVLRESIAEVSAKLARGSRQGEVVALVMERSTELLVGMCACLHAGRAFLPIPSSAPAAYKEEILRNAGVELILHAGHTSPDVGVRAMEEVKVAQAAENALGWEPRHVLQQECAYLLCTSGSTGRPKAVMVTRAGLDNYLQWASSFYRVEHLQGAIAQLSPTFDAFLTQSLLPLLNLRQVRVVAAGEEMMGLVEQLRSCSGPWLLKLTPSQLLAVAAERDGQGFGAIEGELVLGGEAVTAAHVSCARRLLPRCRLHNEYGPTETVVGSCVYTFHPSLEVLDIIPVGEPIARTEVLVVDEQGETCLAGQNGEFLIGGAGLALGYLGAGAATAAAFVPDSRNTSSGARLYRTGDFGFRDEAGVLHFLGRKDSQLKIRGQRVELGEVASRVAALEGIAASAVDVYTDPTGAHTLVAWIQLRPGAELSEVRKQAAARIPAFLLPSRWQLVESIPLTPHGKTDLRQLRAISTAVADSSAKFEEEPSLVETTLRRLWKELLGHADFSAEDAFASVGGHSMLMIRLRARLRSELGVEVPLQELVQAATLQAMAQRVASRIGPGHHNLGQAQSRAAPQPEPWHEAPFPLSALQQQIWQASAQARAQGRADPYSTPAAVRITGELDLARLRLALTEVVERHGSFRLRFLPGDPVLQEFGPMPRWQWHQEILDDESSARERLLSQAAKAVEPLGGALLSACVLTARSGANYLMLVTHHLISDERSLQILIRELLAAYQGTPLPPSPAKDSYARFCLQQKLSLESSSTCDLLQIWAERFADNPVLTSIPAAVHTTSTRGQRSERISLEIPPSSRMRLEELAHVRGMTSNAVMLTIIGLALGLTHGLPKVRLASPVDIRDGDFHTVGCFLNTVCFTVHCQPDTSVQDCLTATWREVVFALAHCTIPYSWLQNRLPPLPDGNLAHARFVFMQEMTSGLELPGCAITPFYLPAPAGKFDLMISVQPARDGLDIHIDFDPDRYAREVIDRICHRIPLVASALMAKVGMTLEQLRADLTRSEAAELARRSAELAEGLADALRRKAGAGRSRTRVPQLRLSQPHWLPGVTLAESSVHGASLLAYLERAPTLDDSIRASGALLLRGFKTPNPAEFEQAVTLLLGDSPSDYENRSTPRRRIRGNVFTSTEYPRSESIPLHNENSYSHRWPTYLAFLCVQPAAAGGETPIADSRRILESISATTRAEFAARGVSYLRHYGKAGLSWQETFQTASAEEVTAYCRAHGIHHEWCSDGSLRTVQTLPAMRRHPRKDELVWFNQAHLFHVSSIGSAAADALSAWRNEELPRHATFGDGSPIPAAMLREIRAAYERHTVQSPWRRGDLLILDNMLWAHGRRPFEGPREVLVVMTGSVGHTTRD